MKQNKNLKDCEATDEGMRALWRKVFPRLVEVLGDPMASDPVATKATKGPGYIMSSPPVEGGAK